MTTELKPCDSRATVRRGLHGRTLANFSFVLAGAMSLAWFLIRVIPKPSRAAYPCMRAAAPMASGFVLWLLGFGAISLLTVRQSLRILRRSSMIGGVTACALLFTGGALVYTLGHGFATTTATKAFVPSDAANSPMGTAKGINPGRVVWVRDATAATWNGTGNWWEGRFTNQAAVSKMLSNSLQWLTGQTSDSAAWRALFVYFNSNHGKGAVGYVKGEKIAVKLNFVNCSDSAKGNNSTWGNANYPAPQVVRALLRQLVNAVGAPETCVTFYDATRFIPNTVYDSCHGEFPGAHFVAWKAGNGREAYKRDSSFTIHWSSPLTQETGGGNPTFLPTCVTKAAYVINLGNLKGHSLAGVTFCAKNQFGSLCASRDGVPYQTAPKAAGVHPYVAANDFSWGAEWTFTARAMKTYNPIVDLMGHRDLGAKTLLYMVDGLYAAKDQNANYDPTVKFTLPPFNGNWPSSLFLSQDGVAIESVCLDFLRSEPAFTTVAGSVDNYLHEAAQADNPPSGTVYDPMGSGTRLPSLGVHEHWNNAVDRKYSRNLGTGGGIELVSSAPATAITPKIRPAGRTIRAQSLSNVARQDGFSVTAGGTFSDGPAVMFVTDVSGRTLWSSAVCLRNGRADLDAASLGRFSAGQCAVMLRQDERVSRCALAVPGRNVRD